MSPALILAIGQALAAMVPVMQEIVAVAEKIKSGQPTTDDDVKKIVAASQASDPAAFESLAKAAGIPWPPQTPAP
jgi:hypothetical protein